MTKIYIRNTIVPILFAEYPKSNSTRWNTGKDWAGLIWKYSRSENKHLSVFISNLKCKDAVNSQSLEHVCKFMEPGAKERAVLATRAEVGMAATTNN